MISIDNAVELMMQTYIRLPKRISGLDISRRERDDICSTFPALLDGIETHAAHAITGINLGEIEWFYRLRNELYHQGNGLTVERKKVEIYAELANVLFENLFGSRLKIGESKDLRKLGDFISTWVKIEKQLSQLSANGRFVPPMKIVAQLYREGSLTTSEYDEFEQVRRTRNEVIHGRVDPKSTINKQTVDRARRLSDTIKRAVQQLLEEN